jgi:NodT family efflux transporter outer membrane factor (OMF) lipoprotein
MVGPNYQPPENVIPENWSAKTETASCEPLQIDWWRVFNDPLLEKYLEMAAGHNKELLIAEANILQARALRQMAAAALFPQAESNINATKTYFSKNGPVFVGNTITTGPSSVTGLPFQIQTPQVQTLYNALFDVNWEIDLFGKTRRGMEAAKAIWESSIEERNDILITLLAEIARNYIELRSNQKRAQLLEENVAILEELEAIMQVRFEKGYINLLDLEAVLAEVAEARARVPPVNAEIYRSIYTLSILTGNLPETLVDELMPFQAMPLPPKEIAVGLRSDLLRRRPDVRSAERQLAAATANVGVAVASFYPSIVLSADAGFQSLKLNNLFTAKSKTWDFGGNIGIPIFQGGSLIGNLHAMEAAANAAAFAYQQIVLSALQEAESALIAYADDLKTARELLISSEMNYRIVELTRTRFDKGLVGRADLIDKKKILIQSELNLLDSGTKALTDLIILYKALGGGWEPTN